jgi:flagellar export protein FliJ
MARSIARLRKLATYRSRLERVQEARLALARRDSMQRESSLQESRERLDAMLSLEGANRGEVDPAVLAAGSGYVVRVNREIETRARALQHYRSLEDKERQQVLELRRDRRAMESLLERELERQAEEERRTQAQLLDERAGQTWLRNRG